MLKFCPTGYRAFSGNHEGSLPVMLLQRAIDTSGERVYFTAGSGGIYRTGGGQAWSLMFLQ